MNWALPTLDTSTLRFGEPAYLWLLAGSAAVLVVWLWRVVVRRRDVRRMRQFGMSGCATVVMIDPASRNRFAGADPRRDCYAIAY